MGSRAGFTPAVADERIAGATGRDWRQWFELLDTWGAANRPHAEIARYLQAEHGTGGWWAQSITVGYERARRGRAPGQRSDGWTATASRTVAVPVERLFDAFQDDALRPRWLPNGSLRVRTATAPRSARYDWNGGPTRVNVGFTSLREGKSRVALLHERLPNCATAEEMRAWWRARLGTLASVLGGGS